MKIFVGCYTKKISEELNGKGEGIYCLDFDPFNGHLKLVDIIPALNPSYLTLSKYRKFLYAVEEIPMDASPKIKAFKVNPKDYTPPLNLISEQELPGSFSCHLSLTNSQTHLIVAAYMSGNVLVYPIGKEGEIFPLSQNIQHKGAGPNKLRQEAAHAHMIYPFGDNGVFAVDLGLDIAKFYDLDTRTGKMFEASDSNICIQKGAGARHMVIHPDSEFAFVFSELTSELFSFRIKEKKIRFIEVLPSLPKNQSSIPSGAAIRMHPNGRFLYVSNRSNNSISIFHFDKKSEKLKLAGYESSGGKTPREINIDPSGQWLLVANQDSDNIVVFSIDQSNGLLEKNEINKEIKTPCCIQFLEN
jgi:6-phosphogluconolactonase